MRIVIQVVLLALVGSALPGCGGHGALPAGGTGGASPPSSGGTVAASGGGAGGSTVRPLTGGAGGAISTGGAGGALSTGGTGGGMGGGMGGVLSSGGAGGSTLVEVAGAPCAVEGQQSACATGRPLMSACGSCMGHWLVCQGGKWTAVHCDPPPPEPPRDASVDGRDAGDASDAVDAAEISPPVDDGAIDTGPIDSASPVDGAGILRGHLVYAHELMAFEACGTTNLAWANLQGWEAGRELLPTLGPFCVTTDAGPAPCPGTIYVELAGTVVTGGSYGHMGKFTSQLTVGRYLAASSTGPSDCPFLTPVYPN